MGNRTFSRVAIFTETIKSALTKNCWQWNDGLKYKKYALLRTYKRQAIELAWAQEMLIKSALFTTARTIPANYIGFVYIDRLKQSQPTTKHIYIFVTRYSPLKRAAGDA